MNKDPKYARRLLKLATFLEKLPRKRFDFSSWVGDNWKGKQDLSCGTTGCAMGWAATIPSFRRLGLRLFMRKLTLGRTYGVVAMRDCRSFGHEHGPKYPPWVAAKIVFGLDDYEAELLFQPKSDYDFASGKLPESATQKMVAAHIRRFVKAQSGSPRPKHVSRPPLARRSEGPGQVTSLATRRIQRSVRPARWGLRTRSGKR